MLTHPTTVWPYFDKVQLWLRQPIDKAAVAKLRAQCGRGGIHAQKYPAAFDASYSQRIELRQPSDAALKWVAGQSDLLINRAEVALDFVFDCVADRQDAFEYLHHHLVRRWHGKRQKIKLVGHTGDAKPARQNSGKISRGFTRYDGSRRAPNSLVLYEEAFSRHTGEVATLHLEWRLNGRRAVQNAGIKAGKDLVAFDHRAFWTKRLLLVRPDPDYLGRLVRNSATGAKRRWSDYLDGRAGAILVNSVGTVQELFDRYSHLGRISRSMERIPVEHWLPNSE